MTQVAVILSGCGVFDGAEIHEAVCVLQGLSKRGASYQCLAPDKDFDVVNHITGENTGEQRNVLVEAARIARGNIKDIAQVNGGDFDAVIVPGGFGAAKNLCTFAFDGPDCEVDEATANFLQQAQAASKPIGFTCIAPALCAKVFGTSLNPTITIGNDEGTAAAIESLGAKHADKAVTEIVVDEANKIVTTPAYMYDASIAEVFEGIDALVGQVAEMA